MIETIPATASTNADLAARLRHGERIAEGYWLRAERQTAGKGRAGRTWQSPAGNLACSTVVNLDESDSLPATFSLVAGLAAYDAVASVLTVPNANLHLKWPNDILYNGAKLAGILCELVDRTVVVGIGLNVQTAPHLPGRATTSLADIAGHSAIDAGDVLIVLADAFALRLAQWRQAPLSDTLAAWETRATPRGTAMNVHAEDVIEGRFDGLESDGSLRLLLADGSRRAIYAGDVILREND